MTFNELRDVIGITLESRLLVKNFKSSELLHYLECIQKELFNRGLRPYATFKLNSILKKKFLNDCAAIEECSDEGSSEGASRSNGA